MISYNTTNESMVTKEIKYGKLNSLNLDNLNYRVNYLNEIIIPINDILRQKYRGIILQNCVRVELTDELLEAYKYQPKKMSLDLYGNIDLWHLILWVNNMTSVTQFNRKNLILFRRDRISLINKIIEREKVSLENNHKDPTLVELI